MKWISTKKMIASKWHTNNKREFSSSRLQCKKIKRIGIIIVIATILFATLLLLLMLFEHLINFHTTINTSLFIYLPYFYSCFSFFVFWFILLVSRDGIRRIFLEDIKVKFKSFCCLIYSLWPNLRKLCLQNLMWWFSLTQKLCHMTKFSF